MTLPSWSWSPSQAGHSPLNCHKLSQVPSPSSTFGLQTHRAIQVTTELVVVPLSSWSQSPKLSQAVTSPQSFVYVRSTDSSSYSGPPSLFGNYPERPYLLDRPGRLLYQVLKEVLNDAPLPTQNFWLVKSCMKESETLLSTDNSTVVLSRRLAAICSVQNRSIRLFHC